MAERRLGSFRVRVVGVLLVMTLAVTLTACGFQPRGQAGGIGALSEPITIRGARVNSPLYRELRREITAAGSSLAAKAADDTAVLRLSKRSSDRRVLSVDDRNKSVEFELEESVRFSLQGRDGTEQLAPQTVRVVRILFRPRETVLSADREEELLRADMRRDLAQRIVRRLASAL